VPKILIVDDDTTVTQLLTALLTMEGHQSATVNDSSEAMGVAGSFHPDLVMLDLMMPGLNGFELSQLLRQDSRFNRIPILVVSAMDDPESRSKAIRAGATEFITKPFRTNALIEKIDGLLKQQNS
jgi:putative two-component system response regulator